MHATNPGRGDSGALYVFLNDNLQRPVEPVKQRLVGSTIHGNMELGRLDVEVGNVRGETAAEVPYDNCIFAGCIGRLAIYEPLQASVAAGGAVEIDDFNHPLFDGSPSTLFAPPVEDVAPSEVQGFGGYLAIGDVTRDGIDDLIASAPGTVLDDSPLGRFYAFEGHPDFVPAPGQQPFPHPAWERWIGVNAPEPLTGDTWGSSFGDSIAAANLDADSAVEAIVGRPGRTRQPKVDAPQGGSAYVFREPVVFQAGGAIAGFALGATGEEAYLVVADLVLPVMRRLERINLRSGVASSVPLDPVYTGGEVPYGDPTGFIFANVIDQDGDNDGDGYTNRQETLAGSSPYDATSRPPGPKVTLSFTASNAIVITYYDPDGVVHPTGGLDLATLSLEAGSHGEVFPFLMSYLTFVDVQPDGKTASAVFGGLPLPSGFKLPLEASVADKSGAVGWDWQVTPPGKL